MIIKSPDPLNFLTLTMPPLLHKVPKKLRELAEAIIACYIYLILVQFIQLAVDKGKDCQVCGMPYGVAEIPH